MSWAKRRTPGQHSSGQTPPIQMYNPNHHSTQENQWQHNWYNNPQQQPQQNQPLQQQLQQPQQQQPPQHYQQEQINPTSQTNYWSQPQPYETSAPPQQNANNQNSNQTHGGQQYTGGQTSGFYQNTSAGYEQQAYGNLQYSQQQQQFHQNQNNFYAPAQKAEPEGDAWNWAWGDEDNSNVQPVTQNADVAATIQRNNIGASFANDESWNWSLEDSRVPPQPSSNIPEPTKSNSNDFDAKFSQPAKQVVNTEKKPEIVNKALRGKLETPQWSTESQISQESSDDILHTSESDKSHLVSRSSTISHSPVSGQDLLPPPSVLKATEENSNEIASGSRHGQFENKEIVNGLTQGTSESGRVLNKVNPTPPPPKHTPPPPKNTQTPPLLPPSGTSSDDTKNPYKRSVGLPYKPATFKAPTTLAQDPRQSPFNPPAFHNQQVNLETVPDNSEHPDTVPALDSASKRVRQWPENNEAPINDRNQYLETGQLSDPSQAVGYGQNDSRQESNDTLPPPGLQRMIPGQFEQNENGDGSASFRDEQPPPGLSRMVLGQTEAASNAPQVQSQEDTRYDSGGPPDGLRRMVPGESSSPETSLIQQHTEGNDSEAEFLQHSQHASQSRSATIGADTPPSVQNVSSAQVPAFTISQPVLSGNRSETIGGDTPESTGPVVQDSGSHVRVSSISSSDNRGVLSKTSASGKSKEKNSGDQNSRRDYIEGQNHQSEIANITNSIRTLTVGENLTDGQTSNTSLPELSPRRRSRQESSDSDSDRKTPPRHVRDKKSLEKSKSRDKDRDKYRDRDRPKERYSPDPYKDRRDNRRDNRKYRHTRYEDESDYYSDKDKDRRNRDEREKDYSSLRREKERRRKNDRDPREREYQRDRRGEYYYNRYEDDYKAENRSSRPSSRSDSMHDPYRERRYDREGRDRKPPRDKDRARERDRYRQREAYSNPYQNMAYDPYNPYYQQYQYYEKLRLTNPQAYAEWYRKYYQQQVGSTPSYGEDRASVHSGRSSANDELAKDRYTRQSFYSQSSLSHLAGYYGQSHNVSSQYGLDNSSYTRPYDQTDNSLLYEEQQKAAQRFTPSKFSTAHIKASIASGKLLRILPNYPMDGQIASVEICNLPLFLEDNEEYRELSMFPGPLVKGTTHKKTIIEYCDSKIRGAMYNKEILDVESYILMWELLILLIRQNGMVVGTDIAELLLKNKTTVDNIGRPSSVLSSISSTAAELNPVSEASNQIVSENTGSLQSILKEEDITNKFREYLLYGSGKEALEWAMKHGLWGHALFLASKLDKRTYANVMMRFANGLPINDPLQTLYQLLSGKIPAAVTCVSDDKWGDWKPHLAMILSNSSHRPELNCKAITSLGDTLMGRGSLYAAQFCYLMAEVGFGKHDNPETKMVLLGSDHRSSFPQYATNEAIHMTEIYEYACSLNNQDFVIPEFQIYKYLIATRLADMGLLEKSLQYLEKVAYFITSNPTSVSANFVDHVCNLADKLKFYDPVGDVEDESEFGSLMETSRPDTSWLKDLRAVQSDFQAGYIAQEPTNDLALYPQPGFQPDQSSLQPGYESVQYDPNQEIWQLQQQIQNQQQNVWNTEQQAVDYYQPQQQESLQQQQQPNDFSTGQYADQQLWPNQQQQQQQIWEEQQKFNVESVEQHQQQQNYYEPSIAQPEPEKEVEKPSQEGNIFTPPQPQISMPNQSRSSEPQDQEEKKQSPAKPKVQSPKQEKVQSTGWFGGIFSKLAMKPKNQMKLPDDKNPKIVWDQEKKRWTNVDDDTNDPANEFKPPPKMADLLPKPGPIVAPPGNAVNQAQVPQTQQPLTGNGSENYDSLPAKAANQTNMFKMQRNRNVKNAYVDVFNPSGKPSSGPTSLPAPDQMLSMAATPQRNFFIPQPVHDPNAPTDFLTPAPPMPVGEPQ